MTAVPLASPVYHDVYPFISPEHSLKDAARDRTVLITGAGSGIGKATAVAFAKASARTMVIVGRTLSKLEAVKQQIDRIAPEVTVLARSLNVADKAGVDQLFEELNAESTIVDSDVDLWWQNWEIMVKGPYMLSRAFIRQLRESQHRAAIVMVSSLGSYALVPESSAYGSCKAALNRVAEWIAAENQDQVQVTGFHPGGVGGTELTANVSRYLAPHMTETAELGANTAVYLTTPHANYLSGRYVDARWDLQQLSMSADRIVKEDLLKMSLLGDNRPYRGG